MARCASTIIGGSSRRTVIAPRTTCATRRPSATIAGITMSRRFRQASKATAAVSTMRALASEAVVRWEYSMMACRLRGGSKRP